MLTDAEVIKLRDHFDTTKRPLFFYHDDPDGLASYIMSQHYCNEGRGVVVKAHPLIGINWLPKVQEVEPDKVFILDIAQVDQEFIDACPVPIVWVDHHDPQKRDNVAYFNPRVTSGKNVPTPALIWQVTQKDLWLATLGCIGDWYLPPFADEFRKEYPDLLPKNIKTVEQALFDSPLTELIRLFSFILKGPTSEVNKNVRVLSKVEGPEELLKQSTSRGKLLWRAYEHINESYKAMINDAFAKIDPHDKLVKYIYNDDRLSLTKDLANELLYRCGKVVVLGRERFGEVRCSLRSPAGINLKAALEKALVGIQGYGGGHENACGAAIKVEDFPRFLENLRAALKL